MAEPAGPDVAAASACLNREVSGHAVPGRTERGTIHDSRGANILGNPRIALTWLANELSQHDVESGTDQIVTTGICVVPVPIAPNDVVTGGFEGLESMQVRFAD